METRISDAPGQKMTQRFFLHEGVSIIHTMIESSREIYKHFDVSVNRGEYFESISSFSDEAKPAIIAFLNAVNAE